MNTQISIITMGGYGWNFSHRLQGFLGASVLRIDSINDEGRERVGRIPDIAFEENFSESDKKQIKEFVKDLEFVYILAGLGGSNTKMIAPLLEILQESGVLPITLLAMPYKSEGAKKNDLSNECLERVKSIRGLHIVFSNEMLLEYAGGLKIGIRAMYEMYDEAVIEAIRHFEMKQQPVNLWDLLGYYDEVMARRPLFVQNIPFSF